MSKLSPRCRVLSLVLLGGVAACGSSESEDERPVPIQDPMQFDATPETRAQLGIERWGLTTVTPDETWVHGYDAKHRMTLQLHQKVGFGGPGERHLESDLSGEHGTAAMKISVITRDANDGDGLDTKEIVEETLIAENTFDTNDQAQRTMERLRADMAVAAPVVADGAPPQATLVKQSRTIGLLNASKDEGIFLVDLCKWQKKGEKCNKEDGVKLVEKFCTSLLTECNKELVAAEQTVLLTNSACAHKAKNTSRISRTWCSVTSSESCARDNAAVDDCTKAVKEARAAVDASGDCLTNRRLNSDCAGPSQAWDRYESDAKKQADCERELRDSRTRFEKCYNACLQSTSGMSDWDKSKFCSEDNCSAELNVSSKGQSLDDCKAKR